MSRQALYVARDECTGCELCTQTVPKVFEMTEDPFLAEVAHQPTEDISDDELTEAMESCPVECIRWGQSQTDYDGGKRLPGDES